MTKRIAREITFTRLPTGHTHDDIEAVFAILWKHWYSFSTIDTMSQLQEGIRNLFSREEGMLFQMHDWVMVIPDYKVRVLQFLSCNSFLTVYY